MPPIVRSGQHTQEGIQGLQNAMLVRSRLDTNALGQQQMSMENQEMQRQMQNRAELEALLTATPPEQRERAGLEFLKQRDPEKAAKLQAQYVQRFSQKARIDPKNAAAELENATGEKIELGNRYSKLPIEGGEAYVDNLTGHVFQPNTAKEIAQIRADFAAQLETQRQEGRKDLETLKAGLKPSKQIERTVDLGNQVEYIYTDGTTKREPKGMTPGQAAGSGGPKTYGQKQFVTLYENGIPKNYWVDPVAEKMTPAPVHGGRTEPRDIPAASQAIIQSADASLPVLDELERDLKTLDSGPFKGRLQQFSLKNLGGMGLGAQEVAIRTKMGRLTADQIFGEGGKQLTGTEKAMIEPFVVNQLDTLGTAMAKLPELRKRIQRIRQSRISMMNPRTRAAHADIAEPGSSSAPPQAESLRKKYNY